MRVTCLAQDGRTNHEATAPRTAILCSSHKSTISVFLAKHQVTFPLAREKRAREWKTISKSNWTDWSAIQRVIVRLISKLDERKARERFGITSTIIP